MALPPETKFAPQTELDESLTQFNNERYVFDVFLLNERSAYRIPAAVISDLTIVDDINSIFPSGRMVIQNHNNALESRYEMSRQEITDGTATWSNFNFNTTGKDLLVIQIRPAFMGGKHQTHLPPEIWNINYIFEIYDTDEIHSIEDQFTKYKIFHLRHYREQMLDELNITWSTAQIERAQTYDEVIKNGAVNPSSLSDLDRGIKTGTAIKDLLQIVYNFNVNFSDDWDAGAGSVFYSSPASSQAIDDLEYLLDLHVSDTTIKDYCILRLERDDKFSLLPIQEHFSRCNSGNKERQVPGNFTIDIFTMGDNIDGNLPGNSSNFYTKRLKARKSNALNYDAAFTSDNFVGMTNFSFLNVSVEDSMHELVTTPVHTSEIGNKTFTIRMKDHNIGKIRSDFQKSYIDKMFGDKPQNLIPTNSIKEKNRAISNVFTCDAPIAREKIGAPSVMYKALMYGTGINFTLQGSLARKAARFVSIMNLGTAPDTGFQDILQGEWFITRIVHSFIGNKYYNDITAAKPYSYKKIN